jgi:MarR family transcriptional regulator for hemolysin
MTIGEMQTAMSTRAEIENAFSESLFKVVGAWRAEADRVLAPLKLSEATARPILFIHRIGDGVSKSELAKHLGKNAGPPLSRLLDHLCQAGMITRFQAKDDKRSRTLHLTEAGRAVAEKIERAIAGLRSGLLEHAQDEDLEIGLRLFRTIEAGRTRAGSADQRLR